MCGAGVADAAKSKACASPPKNEAQLARLRGAALRAGFYVMAESHDPQRLEGRGAGREAAHLSGNATTQDLVR